MELSYLNTALQAPNLMQTALDQLCPHLPPLAAAALQLPLSAKLIFEGAKAIKSPRNVFHVIQGIKWSFWGISSLSLYIWPEKLDIKIPGAKRAVWCAVIALKTISCVPSKIAFGPICFELAQALYPTTAAMKAFKNISQSADLDPRKEVKTMLSFASVRDQLKEDFLLPADQIAKRGSLRALTLNLGSNFQPTLSYLLASSSFSAMETFFTFLIAKIVPSWHTPFRWKQLTENFTTNIFA